MESMWKLIQFYLRLPFDKNYSWVLLKLKVSALSNPVVVVNMSDVFWIKFEPNEPVGSFEFVVMIKGGVVSRGYRKPVQQGVENLNGGVITGYQ